MKHKEFFQAVENSDTAALATILEGGFDINYVTEQVGLSALHFAVSDLNNTVVEFLLDVKEKYNLNVNIKNIEGITPLSSAVMLACNTKDDRIYNKNLQTIAMLLNAGADCLVRDNKGLTALRCAELMDNKKMIFNLLKANSKPIPPQPYISSEDAERSDQSNQNLLPTNIVSSGARQTLTNQPGKKPGFWIVDRIYEFLPSNPFCSTENTSLPKLKKN